jgi:hypothetical protein
LRRERDANEPTGGRRGRRGEQQRLLVRRLFLQWLVVLQRLLVRILVLQRLLVLVRRLFLGCLGRCPRSLLFVQRVVLWRVVLWQLVFQRLVLWQLVFQRVVL